MCSQPERKVVFTPAGCCVAKDVKDFLVVWREIQELKGIWNMRKGDMGRLIVTLERDGRRGRRQETAREIGVAI